MRTHCHWAGCCFLTLLLFACFSLFDARPARAQSGPWSCDDLIDAFATAMLPETCLLGLGEACYAQSSCTATPRPTQSVSFNTPGDIVALDDLRSLKTGPNAGAAYLMGGSPGNMVKILVFGDSRLNPQQANPSAVFTLRSGNSGVVCERTRSGMFLQTYTSLRGQIVVNGVTIQLGSTAYVSAGADLLFDQNPRRDRRNGKRNPNAPLCSGFDSDCDFGDKACSTQQRLVWGPYCRKDSYPYIENGLYRVTLYGRGSVRAGATDYGSSGKHFSLADQEFDLPGSYTFCWNGLAPDGTGFETVVRPLRVGANVDRITMEYLGRNCKQPTAPATADSAPLGVMTVYNVEGSVEVAVAGKTRTIPPQQRIRVYFDNDGTPTIDPVPLAASYVVGSSSVGGSPLMRWAQGQFVGGQLESEPPPVSFRADATALTAGECTTLHWDVEHVQAVYLDGQDVTGHESRTVCPDQTRKYTLLIKTTDGEELQYPLEIGVVSPPTDNEPPLISEPRLRAKNLNCPGERIVFQVEVIDKDGVATVLLYHRDPGSANWYSDALSDIGNNWYSIAAFYSGEEYYVYAEDTRGAYTQTLAQQHVPDLRDCTNELSLFWSNDNQDFCTVSTNIASYQTASEYSLPFSFDGGGNYQLLMPDSLVLATELPGTKPLMLFWNRDHRDCFVTGTADGEADAYNGGYEFKGNLGYVYVNPEPGTVPLRLFWNTDIADNHTTADSSEERYGPTRGYRFVRIEGYVYEGPPRVVK